MFDATGSSIRFESEIAPTPSPKPETPLTTIDHLRDKPLMTFDQGQEIYAEGDKSGALYLVAFGVVRIYRLLSDGRRQICAFHMPGEVFGFEAGAERHFFADAVVRTGIHVLRPGSQTELSHELLMLSLASLNRAHDHLMVLGRQDALGRVAAFLVEMTQRQQAWGEGTLDLPMTRADIGDYLGLTIESVSRALSKLRKSGVVRLPSARQINIIRRDTLEALAE